MAAPLVTFTADGNSNSIQLRNYVGPNTQFAFTVFYTGTFGSGTVKLQASPDDGTTWVDIPNSSATAATVLNMEIRTTKIRANLAGSSGASLSVYII